MKIILTLFRNQWDRAIAIALVFAAAVALTGAWIGASGTILTFDQIPYLISGGLAGVCLAVTGVGLWLSADLRDEWRKLDRLEDAVHGGPQLSGHPDAAVASDGEASAEKRRLRMTGA